jgi:threonylcarbamoyladenosine tRNA methylthiotransferase MtaB
VTVGCRLNACETEWVAGEMARSAGGEVCTDPRRAALIVLGTCCITARSRAESRKTARRLAATGARVLARGCSVRLHPEDFDGIAGLEPMTGVLPAGGPSTPAACRSRGILKVQDGCDGGCSFCVVPSARGRSRSGDPGEMVRRARRMAAEGFREIVLTGTDLASYGRDLGAGTCLCGLVEAILAEVEGVRIRLGSMEPGRLDAAALEGLRMPGVCRHLHLPLQSASPAVLERAGRWKSPVEDLLERARDVFEGGAIGADLITGLPGEGDEDFARTLRLLEDGLLDYAHVFPFSPWQGTRAASMPRPPAAVARERAAILRGASSAARRRLARRNEGEVLEMLVEDRRIGGRVVGVTDNYLTVFAPAGAEPGTLVSSPAEVAPCWSA